MNSEAQSRKEEYDRLYALSQEAYVRYIKYKREEDLKKHYALKDKYLKIQCENGNRFYAHIKITKVPPSDNHSLRVIVDEVAWYPTRSQLYFKENEEESSWNYTNNSFHGNPSVTTELTQNQFRKEVKTLIYNRAWNIIGDVLKG